MSEQESRADRAIREWVAATALSRPPLPLSPATAAPRPAMLRRGLVTTAASIVLVMAVGGALALRPGGPFVAGTPGPSASASTPSSDAMTAPPEPSPTPARSSPSGSASVFDEDGLPRTIDGMDVLRGEDIRQHVEATTDDSAFVIAGWLIDLQVDCIAPGPCQGTEALADERTAPGEDFEAWFDALIWIRFDDPAPPSQRWLVLRVHVDGESRIKVDEVLWEADAGGIPLSIRGTKVSRGDAIDAKVGRADDDSPFLIAGWITVILVDCDVVPDPFPANPLVESCEGGTVLIDQPDMTNDWVTLRVDAGVLIPSRTEEPVVLQVHVHDDRAAACPEVIRERCERAVVVDELVWQRPPTIPDP